MVMIMFILTKFEKKMLANAQTGKVIFKIDIKYKSSTFIINIKN